MSRIGKSPIPIPDKVNVTLDGLAVTVKGPKGELKRAVREVGSTWFGPAQ